MENDDSVPPVLGDMGNSPQIQVPPSSIMGYNLKNDKQFHEKRSAIKMQKKIAMVIQQIEVALSLFPTDELNESGDEVNKYKYSLVRLAMDICEQVFFEKKSGAMKKQVVMSTVMPYFANDEKLVEKFIEILMPTIKQSTFLSRNKQRMAVFFGGLVGLSR
jgi:hypothetical protein